MPRARPPLARRSVDLDDKCLAHAQRTGHQPPGPADAAALRAVSLALAGGGTGDEAADALRAVAATVTLAESRARDESARGESVILALV